MLLNVYIFLHFSPFVLMQSTESALGGRTCKTDLECNHPSNFIHCAFCSNGFCELIDKEIFEPELPCKYFTRHCIAKGYGGYCNKYDYQYYEGYGECMCTCFVGTYGKQCRSIGQKGVIYPNAIQFMPPIHLEFNKETGFLIRVGEYQDFNYGLWVSLPKLYSIVYAKLYFIVYDPLGGYLARIHTPLYPRDTINICTGFVKKTQFLHEGMCKLFLRGARTQVLYTANFVIPYAFSTPPGKRVRSFTRQIQMISYLDGLKLSEHTHNYHVNYPSDFDLIPIIRFSDCGHNLASIKRYEFKERIHLTADIFYVNSFLNTLVKDDYLLEQQRLKFKWEGYKVEGDTSRHPVINDFKIGQLSWDLPAYSWIGMYLINLTATGIFYLNRWGFDPKPWAPKNSNFNICLLEVVMTPLVAIISGGSLRFIFTEYGLDLDASKSRDPNSPDGNSKLRFTFTCNWTQEAICRPHTLNNIFYKPYHIKRGKMKSGKVYNFTLKVTVDDNKLVGPSFANQIIVVGEIGKIKTPLKNITIECVYNCGIKTNPKDIVYLRVEGLWTFLDSILFEWVSETEGALEDDMTQRDTPSFILIINEDALKEDTEYEFKVFYNKSPQFAGYQITTSGPLSLTCQIQPESGMTGLTKFKIDCKASSSFKIFEFYDKYETDGPNFSGRMIRTQRSGDIEELVLTRGRLEIISYDEFGMVTIFTLNIKLSEGNQTSADSEKLFTNLIKLHSRQSVATLLESASVVIDLVTLGSQDNNVSRNDVFNNIVKFVGSLPVVRYEDAKMSISTLYNVLVPSREALSLESAWHAAHTLETLTHILFIGLQEGRLCTFPVLYQILSRILDCLYIVLEIKEKYSGNESLRLKYFNPVMYSWVKDISKSFMRSLFHLESILFLRQLPAQKHKLIEASLGNLSIWVKVDIPKSLSNYTREEHRKNMFPIIIPNELAEDSKRRGLYLALKFVTLYENPIWVQKTNTDNLLDVSICYKGNEITNKTCDYPKTLKYGIRVAFGISELISKVDFKNINLTQLDPFTNTDELDVKLPVYKLDPLPLADVDANFKFDSNETELLVLVKKDIRPTYEMLIKEGIKVNSSNPIYKIITDPSNEQHLYYLAVQPGDQVPPNGSVNFGVKIFSKICYTWHYLWQPIGCQSKTDPDTNILFCQCNRLSLIGGLIKEIPYPLEVVINFPLILTVNSAVTARLLNLLIILLAFLLLALICIKADRYDRTKRLASVLPDNFPGEKFGFLVCVVTGSRVQAGTDAAVGIKIYGTLNDSRGHILSSKTHDVMEGFGEDWFVVYEAETLGKISCLDIWHDNAGAKADWFCDSIIIYDLHHKDCYYFIVNDWITLSTKKFPQVCLFPTHFSEVISTSRVFLDYFKSGFHLSHLWLDTIAKHPRDPVSRVDRLCIILCFICISMVVSIILITLSDKGAEDDFSYSVTWFMIEMSFYTCIAATIIACLLMHMFRSTYEIIFYAEKQEEAKTHERKVTRVSIQEDYLSTPSTTSFKSDKTHIHFGRRHQYSHKELQDRTLAEIINLNLMPKPLVPVQLEGDDPNVIIKKKWLFVTWITVVAVILVCVILSLHLSRDLPPVKTKKWVTTIALTVFIHAIIFLPLKITFVSALLAVAFKRIIYKDIYTFDPKDGRQIDLFGNVRYLSNLVHLRSQPIYQPLNEVFREEHRQKMLRAETWRKLYELLVQIMFLIVLGALLTANIPAQYQNHVHLRTMMKNFNLVSNTTDYLNYIQDNYEPYIFKYTWYNWKLLSQGSEHSFFRIDWIYDNVNRMIGKVRLRQLRVKPDYCNVTVNISVVDCAAPFSLEAEDTSNYLPYWIGRDNRLKKDELESIQLKNDWYYDWPQDDSNFFFNGKTGQTYPSGGYTWDLGASSEELEAFLVRLDEEGWVGHYTRAILAQVKMYNVNTRLFSEITLVSEHTFTGHILTTIVVHSVIIDLVLSWWLVLFIFFAFMLCVRIFVLTNFVGVMGLFENWRRPYELLMTVNALAILCYLFLHHLLSPLYVTEYILHSDELNFFDFYRIAHYSFTARALLCALYMFNQIRFYSLWRFGKIVFRFFLTIAISLKNLMWLIGIFVLIQLFLFRAVGYLLLIFIDVAFNPNMFYRHNYLYFPVSREMHGFKVMSFVVCFSSVIIMLLLVCIFAYEYKRVRDEFIRDWTVVNYVSFIYEEIKILFKKPIVRRTTLRFARSMAAKYEARKLMFRSQSRVTLK